MADTNNFVVERKKCDVEAGNSGTQEQESNSESDGQESEWIRKIRSELQARSGQNAGGYVPIKKLPAFMRTPVERYTPRQWQFGLHNRDPKASSSESEVLKVSLAARKLKPDGWDKFCADFVDNPADVKLKSYGIYSGTEPSLKEVQYQLTLDALTLVLVLGSFPRALYKPQQLPSLFKRLVIGAGFNIDALKKVEKYFMILDDLFLCENQIPMALMKKAISKCFRLLPEERKSNDHNLGEPKNPDSEETKTLLDTILKTVAFVMCKKFFAEPCPDKKYSLLELINFNYKVDKLENCPHVFACIHKVMTSSFEKPSRTVTTTFGHAKQLFLRAVGTSSKQLGVIATTFGFCRETATEEKSSGTDTGRFATDERDVEAPATAGTPPTAVTTTFGRAKQFFWRAVGCSRETATEEGFPFFLVIRSATNLKKAGLQIRGVPGMVQQVAYKNGCLFLPIMSQRESTVSYICNMAAYEQVSTMCPFPFLNYLQLMSQLIKTPEDVSYLVDCGVIRIFTGTQKGVFQMWQLLHLRYPIYSDKYRDEIVKPINRHCESALNVMVTDFCSTFCSKPWLVISVISAIILLVATLIQTYVLVIGSDKMQPHFPRGG